MKDAADHSADSPRGNEHVNIRPVSPLDSPLPLPVPLPATNNLAALEAPEARSVAVHCIAFELGKEASSPAYTDFGKMMLRPQTSEWPRVTQSFGLEDEYDMLIGDWGTFQRSFYQHACRRVMHKMGVAKLDPSAPAAEMVSMTNAVHNHETMREARLALQNEKTVRFVHLGLCRHDQCGSCRG